MSQQGCDAAVGQDEYRIADFGKLHLCHDCRRQRQKLGEAGIDHGFDLKCLPCWAAYGQFDDSFQAIVDDSGDHGARREGRAPWPQTAL